MKIFGYVRVSSTDQNEDRQMIALRQVVVTDENIYGNGFHENKFPETTLEYGRFFHII